MTLSMFKCIEDIVTIPMAAFSNANSSIVLLPWLPMSNAISSKVFFSGSSILTHYPNINLYSEYINSFVISCFQLKFRVNTDRSIEYHNVIIFSLTPITNFF